jgi:hypothetical protein
MICEISCAIAELSSKKEGKFWVAEENRIYSFQINENALAREPIGQKFVNL